MSLKAVKPSGGRSRSVKSVPIMCLEVVLHSFLSQTNLCSINLSTEGRSDQIILNQIMRSIEILLSEHKVAGKARTCRIRDNTTGGIVHCLFIGGGF